MIDDPNGFATVFSTDADSRAAQFLREVHPNSIEDLYEIGLVPRSIPIEHLHDAYETAARTTTRYVDLAAVGSSSLSLRSSTTLRTLAETQAKVREATAALGAMADSLERRAGYTSTEAALLAKKVLAVKRASKTAPFMQIRLGMDLLIKTPLIMKEGIHSLLANDVKIFSGGELRLQGSYFHLGCNSLSGELPWWQMVAVAQSARIAR